MSESSSIDDPPLHQSVRQSIIDSIERLQWFATDVIPLADG
jgi:hypothetical protein